MPTLTYPETNITHPEEHYYILAQLQGSHHFLVDIRHENKIITKHTYLIYTSIVTVLLFSYFLRFLKHIELHPSLPFYSSAI